MTLEKEDKQGVIKNVFSTPLGFFYDLDLATNLKKYILSREIEGIESNCATFLKYNLKESKFDFFNSDEQIIIETKQFIANSLGALLNNIQSEKSKYNISFIESWYHIGSKDSNHEVHAHSGCSWCAIYYVDIGDDNSGGNTNFLNPIISTYRDSGTKYLESCSHIIPPIENGRLILFPSYLLHYQALYTGINERIVVACNMNVFSNSN